jgi:hypothetical protein
VRPLVLQTQATPLLGRGEELETIRQWLVGEHVRLLTVTGPAGSCRPRLGLEAGARIADRFPDGVTLVDLTPVRDLRLVLPTLAQTLGLLDMDTRPLANRLRSTCGIASYCSAWTTSSRCCPLPARWPRCWRPVPASRYS